MVGEGHQPTLNRSHSIEFPRGRSFVAALQEFQGLNDVATEHDIGTSSHHSAAQ